MDLRDLDLNLLVVFHTVFQEKQISNAARQLKVTQSAVSNALARLRRSVGDDLFVRTTDGMQPTPYAEKMAVPVAAALLQLEHALRPQEGFQPQSSSRRFSIAMTDVGETYFMPKMVEACAEFAPFVHIASVRASAIDLRSEMEAGRVDLAIGPFDEIPSVLYQRRLFRQSCVAMLRRGHPLTGGSMTLERFRAAAQLIVSSMESPYDRINAALREAGIVTGSMFSVPHFAAVPYIISTTDLVATVPQKLAERTAAPFGLDVVDIPLLLEPLQTNMFWHRRYAQDEGIQWLRGLVVSLFSEL